MQLLAIHIQNSNLKSSSSSPLLSLVQVPAKLAINLSIHTQHTYDNGGRQNRRQSIAVANRSILISQLAQVPLALDKITFFFPLLLVYVLISINVNFYL